MPCFNGTVNAEKELIAYAWVSDAVSVSDPKEGIKRIQEQRIEPCRMLLDTGASCSCVTDRLARKMGLTVMGKDSYGSVSEDTAEGNVYHVHIHVPFNSGVVEEDGRMYANIGSVGEVQVLGIPVEQASFDILLGMDIIMLGSLHVSGSVFTFCL